MHRLRMLNDHLLLVNGFWQKVCDYGMRAIMIQRREPYFELLLFEKEKTSLAD